MNPAARQAWSQSARPGSGPGEKPSTGGKETHLERGLRQRRPGQFIVPDLDLTIVITARAYDDPKIRYTVADVFRGIVAAERK